MNDIPAAGAAPERPTPDDHARSVVAARCASVSNDMRRIFGAPARQAPAAPRVRAIGASGDGAAPPARAGSRRAPLALGLLAATAGVVGGLVVAASVHQPMATAPRSPAKAARPTTPTTPTAMTVALAAPIPAEGALRAPPADSITAASAAAPQGRQAAAAPSPIAEASFDEDASDAGCDARDACLRADVLAADRDLRIAYAEAADAGVERARLAAIRNRWARLRATEYDRPDDLLDDYAEMTDRLERATRIALDDPR